MYLENLSLKDFRNFSKLEVNFDPYVNVFIGANAQGKTNLLEAVYFLALTRSHRTSSDKELINFEAKSATLQGLVHKSQVEVDLKMRLTPKGKLAWVNRLQQKKLSRYVGQMNAILFSPEDLSLVKGGPAIRRRFMNLEFSQINPEYLYFSNQYQQVLQQKNNYLKQLASHKVYDQVFLDVLSEQLAGIAAEIIYRRFKYVAALNTYAQDAHSNISNGQEDLQVQYHPSISGLSSDDSVEEIYQQVIANFKKNKISEIRTGLTLSGPHRDDLIFTINGKNAREFASQGQQRTIALSLKLAEIQLVHQLTSEYPILLLDDVMSELDYKRQTSLLSYIYGKTQTFITTTDLEGISWEKIKSPKIFHLESGNIVKEEN
ncbi:DNA replication and repair protein RecF [Lactobacillus colini]|uniref:DNA replication and repair protein RecF n=1 Tax=Lactobacillus colini TaxID=1819254 RepID=A0ABS4MGT4_9LACO|nr:DNA replication/repair protein RecF [Lactobacillus colini]MBP2058902.1 DNA replication and repair protein RecF [Lactobacillus colini]